jgi:heavy metal sensor kinase
VSRWSIRWQLTLWYALALSAVLIAFSGGMFGMIRAYLLARIDAELIEESNELAEEVEITKSESEFRRRFQQRYSDHANFGFQVNRMDGSVLFGSPWLDPSALPHPASATDVDFRALQNTEVSSGNRQRVLSRVLRLPEGPLVVHVLTPLSQWDSQLRTLLGMLVMNGFLALGAAVIVGHLMARRMLLPILGITALAERISSENLSERVPIANRKDELGRLGLTLNRTFDRLQRSITEMRRFTADAAHELRTPLAVIRTEAEVALREHALHGQYRPEQFHRVAEVTLAETTRLSNLVGQLLTLSRQDAGLQRLPQEDVSLKALLLDVMDALRVVVEKKGQTLTAGELCERTVMGDDISLSQLFFNLIDNASKYTPVGGQISVTSTADADHIRIAITDSGIGIEARHFDHLFDRFYRVDASRSGDGTGLGLAICRSIVQAHHGDLQANSKPGQGSTFTVILPVGTDNST